MSNFYQFYPFRDAKIEVIIFDSLWVQLIKGFGWFPTEISLRTLIYLSKPVK